jgi:hypothetical protein
MYLICCLFHVSCKTSDKISGNYTHEIECMGTELDGSVTLKTWGKGKNRVDALQQAKKEAINSVLFKGIRNGKPNCYTSAIFNTPNIRNNNDDYFNDFFKDSGKHKDFVSIKDESFGKKESAEGRDGEIMFGFIIRVLRSELKQQMITDGLLNN